MVLLARFRRNIRPVNSLKHVIDTSFTTAAGTQVDTFVIDAVNTPVLTTPQQVAIGSTVNSIYLRVEVASTETDAGAIPNCYLIVTKIPGNNFASPVPSSIGTSDLKKYVIYQEMVMLNNLAGGNPRTLFNGVIVIPKGYRRNGNDDTLSVSVVSTAVNIAVCIQCIYKEYK